MVKVENREHRLNVVEFVYIDRLRALNPEQILNKVAAH